MIDNQEIEDDKFANAVIDPDDTEVLEDYFKAQAITANMLRGEKGIDEK